MHTSELKLKYRSGLSENTAFFNFQLRKFNKENDAGSGARAQEQAEETVKANIQWRKDNEHDIGNWLTDFLKAKNIALD